MYRVSFCNEIQKFAKWHLKKIVAGNVSNNSETLRENSIIFHLTFSQSTKNPFLLSRSEAERIDIPKPDPSLSKVSPASSSPTISSSPTSASLKESTLLKRDEQSQTSSNQNALQLGKFVPLVASIQRPVAVPTSYVLPVMPYRLLHSSLHHTQDSLGQYDYSYTGDSSAKTESRSLDGTTRGAYSYIDPNGILQQVHYIADHNGFRVLATNLPEAKWWCCNISRDVKAFVFEKKKKTGCHVYEMSKTLIPLYNFHFWISNFSNTGL